MSSRNRVEPDIALDDGAAGHAIARGMVLGTPIMFAIVTIIGLVEGASAGDALVLAIWPAIVTGPFIGGLALMGRLVAKEERAAAPVPRRAFGDR